MDTSDNICSTCGSTMISMGDGLGVICPHAGLHHPTASRGTISIGRFDGTSVPMSGGASSTSQLASNVTQCQKCGIYYKVNGIHFCDLADSSPSFPFNQRKEVRVTDPQTGGQKGQKPCQIGALDPKSLMAVGEVAGFGNDKYERYNFVKGYKWSLSYDALQRHLNQFWGGENLDQESGLPHLAHAAWHCLTLLTFMFRVKGTDDRFPNT